MHREGIWPERRTRYLFAISEAVNKPLEKEENVDPKVTTRDSLIISVKVIFLDMKRNINFYALYLKQIPLQKCKPAEEAQRVISPD